MATERRLASEGQNALSLQTLPVEVLTKIFGQLDLNDARCLSRTNKFMRHVYKSHLMPILLPILSREFSPLDGLLRVTDFGRGDVDLPFEAWSRRPLYFSGTLVSDDNDTEPPARFTTEHWRQVMEVVQVARAWERAFPRLRFAELVEERRILQPHERERVRRALYNWWRYANVFHRHFDVPPMPDCRQSRFTNNRKESLHMLSNLELYELNDLWKMVKAAVATQLCPSYSLLLSTHEGDFDMEDYLAQRAWGDGAVNNSMVGHVLRLGPDHLLWLFNGAAAGYTKNTLLDHIRIYHPTYDWAFENLSHTLRQVVAERLGKDPDGTTALVRFVDEYNFPRPFGGVLDVEPQMEGLRSRLSLSAGLEESGGAGCDGELVFDEDGEDEMGPIWEEDGEEEDGSAS